MDLVILPFDKGIYEQYPTHLDYKGLSGLTVDYIHKWKLERQ